MVNSQTDEQRKSFKPEGHAGVSVRREGLQQTVTYVCTRAREVSQRTAY